MPEICLSGARNIHATTPLGIIQRHKRNGQTVIYLAGTGVNGTGAAVAYLRKNWEVLLEENLLNEEKKENFYKIIKVPRRDREQDLTSYCPHYWWTEKEWIEVDFSCDSGGKVWVQ